MAALARVQVGELEAAALAEPAAVWVLPLEAVLLGERADLVRAVLALRQVSGAARESELATVQAALVKAQAKVPVSVMGRVSAAAVRVAGSVLAPVRVEAPGKVRDSATVPGLVAPAQQGLRALVVQESQRRMAAAAARLETVPQAVQAAVSVHRDSACMVAAPVAADLVLVLPRGTLDLLATEVVLA